MPTVIVAEDAFEPLAYSQAAMLGLEKLPLVVVPRATGGESREHLRQVSEAIFPQLTGALTSAATPVGAAR